MIRPETSKQTFLNEQRSLLTSPANTFQQKQFQPSDSETPAHRNETTTYSNFSSSNGISNSNLSLEEILVPKNYKYVHLKSDTAWISKHKDEKSEVSMRESLDSLYSKFQKNSLTEAEISNYHFHPRTAANSEEFYVTLSKSIDLPTTKFPHDNSLQPNEIMEQNEQYENEKLSGDKTITKESSSDDM